MPVPPLFALILALQAQDVSWVEDFESRQPSAAPLSWSVWPSIAYHVRVVETAPFEGQFALLFEPSNPRFTPDLANLTQTIDAAPYRGKRVRLRAFARTTFRPTPSPDSARLWFVVKRPLGVIGTNLRHAFRSDNWQAYELPADIALDADSLMVGVMVQGGGQVWLDSVSLVVTGAAGPLPATAPGARAYLDSALGLISRHFIRRHHVAWDSVRARALALAEGAKTPAETYDGIREALLSLRDRHSFLLMPEQGRQRERLGSEFADSNARMAGPHVASLRIPPFVGWDSTASVRFARSMHDAISRVAPHATCGWIVDLRGNTGGNMWPMLTGVGPLLGEGVAGAFVLRGGSRTEWSYIGGEARLGDSVQVRVHGDPFSFGQQLPRVAVLIGGSTASSGEVIAISFRGRPNTRIFGRPTAGLSTATTPFQMPDSAYIILATALVADRNGTVVADVVRPDAESRVGASADSTDSASAAVRWLLSRCPAPPG